MNSARKLFLVAGLASAVLASPAQAQVRELPRAKAESVGMSTERLARISATLAADHLGTAIATTPLYLPGPGHGFGLGFAVRKGAGEAAYPAEAGTYYWGGAGGTYFWVDPKTDLFVVFMMQSPKQRVYYRALMHDMVYAAVMK